MTDREAAPAKLSEGDRMGHCPCGFTNGERSTHAEWCEPLMIALTRLDALEERVDQCMGEHGQAWHRIEALEAASGLYAPPQRKRQHRRRYKQDGMLGHWGYWVECDCPLSQDKDLYEYEHRDASDPQIATERSGVTEGEEKEVIRPDAPDSLPVSKLHAQAGAAMSGGPTPPPPAPDPYHFDKSRPEKAARRKAREGLMLLTDPDGRRFWHNAVTIGPDAVRFRYCVSHQATDNINYHLANGCEVRDAVTL